MNNNIVEWLNSKNKVELSAQVVELGLADDLQKQESLLSAAKDSLTATLSEMTSSNNNLIKAASEADKVYKQSETARIKANTTQQKAGSVLVKAFDAAKDLGVDPKQITGYNKVDSLYNDIESLSDKVNKFNWYTAS